MAWLWSTSAPNSDAEPDDVLETSTWHCVCGAMGYCAKDDEAAALDVHLFFGCLND